MVSDEVLDVYVNYAITHWMTSNSSGKSILFFYNFLFYKIYSDGVRRFYYEIFFLIIMDKTYSLNKFCSTPAF